jgi:hypothetical protein
MRDLRPFASPPQGGILEHERWSATNSVKKLHSNAIGGKLFHSEQGQGLVEYAVMLGLLLSLLIVAKGIGSHANQLFQWVANNMQ